MLKRTSADAPALTCHLPLRVALDREHAWIEVRIVTIAVPGSGS